jgi:hypothetical protein
MNYQKIYDKLIERGKNSNRKKLKKDHPDYQYFENHHILAKCVGGSDEPENLVLLTAREHFLCHWILARIYPKNYKLANAFWMMNSGNNKDRNFNIVSNINRWHNNNCKFKN